jgi:hypothetical protein
MGEINTGLVKNAKNNTVSEYIELLESKCNKLLTMIKSTRKKKKIKREDNFIPSFTNYILLFEYDYKVPQLKLMANKYKLKTSGNKDQLFFRLFTFLYLSYNIVKLQSFIRGRFVRKYYKLHGPAAKKRELCINETDFITMEPIQEIAFHQFFSYTDASDNKIYGFDLVSLYNMLKKNESSLYYENPYNRKHFPLSIIKQMKTMIKLSKIIHIPIDFTFENDIVISNEKLLELRILEVFQKINSCGNYTEPKWFYDLTIHKLNKFINELIEIWNFRANLPLSEKLLIAPNGNPFRSLNNNILHNHRTNIHIIRKIIIEVMDDFLNGIHLGTRQLGANLLLCALTLVSADAANAMPWFYESVIY